MSTKEFTVYRTQHGPIIGKADTKWVSIRLIQEPVSALIEKVALYPTRVTDDDIAAVLASGMSEDQAFELVVCAAVGQATRQYETALGALNEAMGDAHAP